MGCDIHLYLEVRGRDGKWHHAQGVVDDHVRDKDDPGDKPGVPDVPLPERIWHGRHYELFAYLAGVRQNVHGSKQHFPVTGFPSDASPEVRAIWETWDGDGHTPSSINLEDLLSAIENDTKGYPVFVMVDKADRKKIDKVVKKAKGKPIDLWSSGITGFCAQTSNASAVPFKVQVSTQSGLKSFYETMSKACEYALFDQRSEGSGPYDEAHQRYSGKNLRIVFWFDN